ncbi:hypothetical protein NJH49_08880 [Stenotrophomonas maltophilia]|uniref:hypothetical protein n=1 Tax=Stenotrophomonas maltophilia TaxID=40324 RepID=UPI00209771C0|nr:hypothetical protein [Stenotrophomonas maltophilia]MCO7398296.1 hypothetical protein [Stenotrophomonas maltophilia]MCO7411498.1 hypothetical protein [Stenotrophomonas maltophilia]
MTMMDRSKTYAGRSRALFEAAPGLQITGVQVADRLGVVGHVERGKVRRTLLDLVDAGYLRKIGEGRTGVYERTGAEMRRLPMSPERRRERDREIAKAYKERLRAAESAGPRAPDKMTINRARVALLADLAPAKPWGKEKAGQRPAETVEQFVARGGQVQRLAASWEQAA